MPVSTEERLRFSERRGDPEIQGRDADKRGAPMRVLMYHGGVCVEELGGVSQERVVGLSDAWVLRKRALECWELEATFPLSILISGGSWDGTQAKEAGGMGRELEK